MELKGKIHVTTTKVSPSLALCGEPGAERFFMYPTGPLFGNVKACQECVNHPDYPMILLGAFDEY